MRKGATEAELAIELSDGRSFVKTEGEKGTTFSAFDAHGKKMDRPVAEMEKVFGGHIKNFRAANPVSFLLADKKERREILLKALQIKVDNERLMRDVGCTLADDIPIYEGLSGLRKNFFAERTPINVRKEMLDKSSIDLSATIPPEPEGGTGDVSEMNAKLQEINSETQEKIREINAYERKLLDEARAAHNIEEAANKKSSEEIDDQIRALQEKKRVLANDLQAKKTEWENADNSIARRAQLARESAKQKEEEKAFPIKSALKNAEAVIKAAANRQQLIDIIAKQVSESKELGEKADALTEKMRKIDAYMSDIISSIPISGLSVNDADVFIDGIEFDNVNEAEKIRLAFEIALMHISDAQVKFIFIDGAERLDAGNFKALCARAKKLNVQCLLTRVPQDELVRNMEVRKL